MKIRHFLILVAAVLVFSSIQFFGISIFSIKPNFAIAIIVAASFFISETWEGIFLAALTSFALKFSPSFSNEILVFFFCGIFVMLLGKYLPWHSLIGNAALCFVFTLIFYLILFPSAVMSADFFQEAFYNILLGGLAFLFLSKLRLKQNK